MVHLFLLCLALVAASTTAQVVGVDNRRDITVTSQRNTTLIINGQEVPASIPLTFSGCRYVYRFQDTDPSCQIIEYELPEKRVIFPNVSVEAKFCCAKVEIDRRSPPPRRALRAARALQRGKTANTTTVVPEMSQQGPAAAAEGGPVTGETNVTVNQGDLLQIVLPGAMDRAGFGWAVDATPDMPLVDVANSFGCLQVRGQNGTSNSCSGSWTLSFLAMNPGNGIITLAYVPRPNATETPPPKPHADGQGPPPPRPVAGAAHPPPPPLPAAGEGHPPPPPPPHAENAPAAVPPPPHGRGPPHAPGAQAGPAMDSAIAIFKVDVTILPVDAEAED
ncbi:unnamed protein product [Vitrella brassicaformis CCMP3155]|uniref:Proteinase inhibitor I42 chagasin domain-containing protein n=1 Tax=Vitrella brassicaformis (strain CCMP3155) TaxID=1169540 RepID=A0A0G4EXD0_VITBC|nr:unnamed protein product [Vitrella brassicaformis CCMP3155]|eukprot:CEM03453.1 unnamed protein product [Vitrella brassicaformis CCMP3155]